MRSMFKDTENDYIDVGAYKEYSDCGRYHKIIVE